ncbi:metallopeptidase [Nocardia yunnanensis]|uniref:Metallopeptidase n=1 Tax=Nocardia yunnanensis TaxID=2382165 RepID=A0A386ZL05_9NOCA|nr:metallopeptidase [Nocardia yunnanensis]AYF77824.1 metallopeptidase [Nocardia yunnanensis]
MRKSRLRLAAVLMTAAVALTGCTGWEVQSAERVSAPATTNPWELTGQSSTTGPSGPRPGVPDSDPKAENGDGGPVDTLAQNAVADIADYWKAQYAKTFPGVFTPVTRFVSWDSTAARDRAIEFCRGSTYQEVNAASCSLDATIGWDRGTLLPELITKFGPMAVVMVLAHEYGHAVQAQAKLNGVFTTSVVREQQADCFAGVFLRSVAEGTARHFTLNTTDGLNGVLAAVISFRDREPGASQDEHGTAFERVTAVQIGYTDGATGCKAITRAELQKRRGTLPTSFQPGDKERQLPVDRSDLALVAQSLAQNYPFQPEPSYDYGGVTRDCPNVAVTQPVSYCPSSNVIGADVPALAERAVAGAQGGLLSAMVGGDYNAFVVFVSRYMLALQQNRKLSVTGADTAGLRAACLSGAYSTALSRPGSTLQLTATDLDAAVSGLLSDGLAAADVDGTVVPSGFVRLEAFRTGVLDGDAACLTTYK